jgi:hypothetical protein
MTSVDSLMLDAKEAILDEHRRRFQVFHQEGRVHEAIRQFQVTVSCANDILSDSLQLLEEAIEAHNAAMKMSAPPPAQ